MRVALPASLSDWSFPFSLACPGQYIHRRFQRRMLTTDTFQPGLAIPPGQNRQCNMYFWQGTPGEVGARPSPVQYVFLTRHSRRSGGMAIEVPAIHKLIQSMPWRCPAVMDSWGGHTPSWSACPSVTKYWLTELISWRRRVLWLWTLTWMNSCKIKLDELNFFG